MRRRLAWSLLALSACNGGDGSPTPEPPAVVRAEPGSIEDPILAGRLRELVERVDANPVDPAVHVELGLFYEANRMWTLARRAYDCALTLDASRPEPAFHAALCGYREGDSATADVRIRDLVARFPDFAPARFRMGQLLFQEGRIEEACDEYRTCARLEGATLAAPIALSDALLLLDRPEEALQVAEQALALDPDSEHALHARDQALFALGRGTLGAAEQGLETLSMSDELHARLAQYDLSTGSVVARIYDMLGAGQIMQALGVANGALQARPDEPLLMIAQAACHRRLNEPGKAVEILGRARPLAPRNIRLLSLLASCHHDLGDYQASYEAGSVALDVSPNQGRLQLIVGRSLLKLNRPEEARAALEGALRNEPTLTSAHGLLGQAYSQLARFAEAETALEEAVRRQPDQPAVRYQLCLARIELGKFAEAEADLQRLRAFAARSQPVRELVQNAERTLRERRGR